MKSCSPLILYLIIYFPCWCQDGQFESGARNSALAKASVTISDNYSLFNNIAGLGKMQKSAVFANYKDRYGIKAFQTISAGLIYPSNFINTGFGFFKFGDELYSQQNIKLALSNQLQHVSLGLGINLLQYSIHSIGTRQVFVIDFGGIVEIIPKFIIGAHVHNLNQASIVNKKYGNVPMVMKIGCSYQPDSQLSFNLEVEKNQEYNEQIKLAIEYEIINDIWIRSGVNNNPRISSFGVGFHFKRLLFDYAFSHNVNLGSVNDISFAYLIGT